MARQRGTPDVTRAPRKIDTCFLCKPDPALVYSRCEVGFALCGLGPLVDGYSVVGSVGHYRSVADIPEDELQRFGGFVSHLRAQLSEKYGSCLVTEHGRLPVCDYAAGRAESHCYHAHFLFFPGAPDVEAEATRHFATVDTLPALHGALARARDSHEYFLLSPHPHKFSVMTGQQKLPRQFARTLVANAIDRPDHADWKRFPRADAAHEVAAILRTDLRQWGQHV